MRPRALASLALGAASLAACGGPRVEVRARPAAPVAHRVAAVYPYAFRWEEPPFRSYQKGMDLTLLLSRQRRLLVFGPGDFQVFRHEEADPLLGSSMMAVLQARGLDPRAFLAFRGWAERRVARTTEHIEGGRGPPRVRSSEDVTYVAHLQIVDAAAGAVLVEVEGTVAAGVPEDRPEYDPMPELTDLAGKLARAAWDELEPRLLSPRLPEPMLRVRWLPAAALDFTPSESERSLREKLLLADPLVAEVERLAVYRYFARGAPPERLGRDLRLPGGLYVERALGPFEGQLREGDVVVAVDGEPAAGPQILQRALARRRDGPLLLEVRRGAARIEVTVPATP
jgi:hypothetical protein